VHGYQDKTSELSDWIRDEVEPERELTQGDSGQAVGRVQEWLNLHGFGLVVNQDDGPVTARQVSRFQDSVGLASTGDVDLDTFDALVGPMVEVLRRRLDRSTSLGDAVVEYAGAHLAVHPREVGENGGPWVRRYMQGNSGPAFLWCAGFVTFVLSQAAESLQVDKPLDGSFSCDSLAAQAREAGRFLAEFGRRSTSRRPGWPSPSVRGRSWRARSSTWWGSWAVQSPDHPILIPTPGGDRALGGYRTAGTLPERGER
jgi:peptidoglycan hydrolase-like protein with peptidoglycan-binding domain